MSTRPEQEPDPVPRDADGRIMRPPSDADAASAATEAPDIESTAQATDSSYTAHLDDDSAHEHRSGGGGV